LDITRPLIDSVLIGSLYSLMALGVTLSYSIAKIANFAHGELVTIGAYMAVIFTAVLPLGLPAALAASFTIPGMVALAAYLGVYNPLVKRGSRPVQLMVASITISIILRYLVYIAVDFSRRSYKLYLLNAAPRIKWGPGIYVGGIRLTGFFLVAVASCLAIVATLYLMLTKTRLGKAMRALADNPELAEACGVNKDAVIALVWILAGGLAGLSGLLWASYGRAYPEVGQRLLLSMFAAAVLGGLTSFWGTVLGGYVIGLTENLGIFLLNQLFGLSTGYKPMITFAVLILVLLFRPQGILPSQPETSPVYVALARIRGKVKVGGEAECSTR